MSDHSDNQAGSSGNGDDALRRFNDLLKKKSAEKNARSAGAGNHPNNTGLPVSNDALRRISEAMKKAKSARPASDQHTNPYARVPAPRDDTPPGSERKPSGNWRRKAGASDKEYVHSPHTQDGAAIAAGSDHADTRADGIPDWRRSPRHAASDDDFDAELSPQEEDEIRLKLSDAKRKLEFDITDPLLLLEVAKLHSRLGEWDEAKVFYLEVLEHDPGNPVVRRIVRRRWPEIRFHQTAGLTWGKYAMAFLTAFLIPWQKNLFLNVLKLWLVMFISSLPLGFLMSIMIGTVLMSNTQFVPPPSPKQYYLQDQQYNYPPPKFNYSPQDGVPPSQEYDTPYYNMKDSESRPGRSTIAYRDADGIATFRNSSVPTASSSRTFDVSSKRSSAAVTSAVVRIPDDSRQGAPTAPIRLLSGLSSLPAVSASGGSNVGLFALIVFFVMSWATGILVKNGLDIVANAPVSSDLPRINSIFSMEVFKTGMAYNLLLYFVLLPLGLAAFVKPGVIQTILVILSIPWFLLMSFLFGVMLREWAKEDSVMAALNFKKVFATLFRSFGRYLLMWVFAIFWYIIFIGLIFLAFMLASVGMAVFIKIAKPLVFFMIIPFEFLVSIIMYAGMVVIFRCLGVFHAAALVDERRTMTRAASLKMGA